MHKIKIIRVVHRFEHSAELFDIAVNENQIGDHLALSHMAAAPGDPASSL
jgi:hypothetical protein